MSSASDSPPADSVTPDTPARRLEQLYHYGFWMGLLGICAALAFAVALYALTGLPVLLTAGIAVGLSHGIVLPVRLVRLRGWQDSRWYEWVAIGLTVAAVVGAIAALEVVLP
jgi:hypothetical protein